MSWSIQPLQSLCDDFRKDIVDGPFGSNLKREDYQTEGDPVLKIQNIKEFRVVWKKIDHVTPSKFAELKRHSYRRGDIVMTKLGDPLGVSAIVDRDGEGLIVADLVRIRAQKINTRFLCYCLNAPNIKEFINSQSKGATRPRVRITTVRELPIPVPPLPEQERIVGILDEAFEGIAVATAQAEKNLHNARELFQSVLQSTFSQKGDDWEETTIGDLCKITHGFAFKGKDFGKDNDSAKPIVITPGNFTEDAALSFTDRNTKRFSGESPSGFTFDEGDLVVVMTDLSSKMKILGKPAFIDRPDILHNQRIGRVVMEVSSVLPELLYYFFRTNVFLEGIKLSATGTMVKHTAPKRICIASFSYPSATNTQQAIVEKLDALSEETKALEAIYERKQSALAELKQSLLQKAFAGEL